MQPMLLELYVDVMKTVKEMERDMVRLTTPTPIGRPISMLVDSADRNAVPDPRDTQKYTISSAIDSLTIDMRK